MKTEINFRNPSHLAMSLKRQNEKMISLDRYPTSRNAKIWVSGSEPEWSTTFYLVSYEAIPAYYIKRGYIDTDILKIRICPHDLTATTRRHLYAFIRQYVPARQAESIINTARITFARTPMSKDKYTNESIYEMEFEVYPE